MKILSKQILSIFCTTVTFLLLALSNTAIAEHPHHHHGAYAPIGIMGDHLMDKDEWMLSYRFMRMEMDGNRTGTNRVSTPLSGFMVSPIKMNMDMHMIGGMYGIDQDLTIMTMLPFVKTDMDLSVNMNGMKFNTEADGIGDFKVSAIWKMNTSGTLLNAGLSIPTGSIDEKDDIPISAGVPVQLPYPMQLGSGTYELLLGITQTGHTVDLSWGAQGSAIFRTSDNDNGYTLGNIINVTAWLGKPFTESALCSIRLNARNWDDIDGNDITLATMPTVPTKNTDLRGGTRVDAIIGLNTIIGNNVIGLEIGIPIHQDLHGPQLETDTVLTVGWQVSM